MAPPDAHRQSALRRRLATRRRWMPISSSARGSHLPPLASSRARRGSGLLSSPHQIHPYLHPEVDVPPPLFPYASVQNKEHVRHLALNPEGGIQMSHSQHNPEGGMAMSHHDHHSHAVAVRDSGPAFSRESAGLAEAISPQTVALRDGGTLELRAL